MLKLLRMWVFLLRIDGRLVLAKVDYVLQIGYWTIRRLNYKALVLYPKHWSQRKDKE